ncbi:O-antigen ligase family protein [Sediminibacterium sp.]|uniref:O-antigen ligase family protein n=1 Tax=Sediminibacterium sp. TaxID=1917865 RepID=UPI0025FD82EB|nr:O-antigen ligase family protein [Sediminibacterium sp.]
MPKRATNILLALAIIMLGGLLWSRAILSISMGLMAVYAIYYLKQNNADLFSPLFFWCVSPLLLAFTGIYQAGFTEANLSFLLTLMVYPIAGITAIAGEKFAFTKTISQPWIHAALIALLYPLGWLVLHTNEAFELYGQGRTLPVFMDTDHIRFSIFLCSALLFTLLPVSNARYKKISFAILFGAILLLAVRTGWVIAGIIIVGYGIYYLKSKPAINRNRTRNILIALITLIAILVITPTIQQKIRYTLYDWNIYNTKGYDSTYSDGVRRAINTVALKAIKEDHSTAIGWSAIPSALQQKFTQVWNGQKTQYGWPFNQWLFWWMGSGWWGMVLFTAWLFYPVWYGYRNKNPFLIIWTLAIAFSCLVETTINYQYGALLHVWPLLVCWLTFKKSSN